MSATSENYFRRLTHQLRTEHYNVPASEAADAIHTLWAIIEEAMQDTTESINGPDDQPRGILSFSDMRMTWRAVNLRGNLAYFCTRDEAAEWLRNQPPLGYRAANGNASGS